MSTLYGISSTTGSSDWFSSMLGTSSSSSSSSSTSTSSLTDYALIRSGAYKKLLSAYYSNQESTKTEAETKEEKVNLTSAKSDAKSLATASSKLVNASFDEEDREEIIENIKSFVSSYNEVISDSDDVDDTAVLRNTLWLTKQTSANSDLLGDVGITITDDNELKIDEDKLSTASMSTLSSLFKGYSSYGSYVAGKSSQIYAAANSALNATGSGSAYSSNASYVSALTGNLYDTEV